MATPLAWDEVTPRLRPEQFHLGNVLDRFHHLGELFEGVLKNHQRLDAAIQKMTKTL